MQLMRRSSIGVRVIPKAARQGWKSTFQGHKLSFTRSDKGFGNPDDNAAFGSSSFWQ
jgi:hypothetical protein